MAKPARELASPSIMGMALSSPGAFASLLLCGVGASLMDASPEMFASLDLHMDCGRQTERRISTLAIT